MSRCVYIYPFTGPCKDCVNRGEGCHNSCSLYLQYQKDLADYKAEKEKQRNLERIINKPRTQISREKKWRYH